METGFRAAGPRGLEGAVREDNPVLDYLPDADGTVALLRDRGGRHLTGDAGQAMPVFSATKMLIAVAALRLAESGLLGLDDAARGWLPQVPGLITVRELLSHTAGLPDYAAAGSYVAAVAAQPGRPWGLDQILAAALAGDHSPAAAFRYSNAGYWILGAVMEHAARRPLARILDETVLRPVAMASTFYPDVGAGVTSDGYDTRWAGPAGAAWSTAGDLDRFLAALFDGTLLPARALAAMTAPTPVEAQPPWRRPAYGLGLMMDRELGTFGHGGAGPGYHAAAFIAPESGRSAVILARSSASADLTAAALRWLAA